MKNLVFLVVLMFVSSVSYASSIESFNNIEINPHNDSSHKVTATIHLIVDSPFGQAEDTLAAREIIAMALSNLTLKELTLNGVETAKHHILKQVKSGGFIDGSNVNNVYVTDLFVTFTGASHTTVLSRSGKKSG
ncbi:hypothetical protein KO525_04220 [Psychrosphaera sp. B3R10]|uniref:Flagellar protein FliL n=1 Tax=Psychrosphaera algicola TaxID=3023714 RepID=A0ABT5FFK7_9GAMM|nr:MULTISPECIES: hypothetical protein [unclassified Psychrosphaera]MBU2883124.1 hypothetical protein [Psychrosphaera sp. I2R16]MBU2988580.1 hypothetical protein [Psychrosphaera sp. B3R10]MDC2890340.1 hypothetical protein [Psychrosphaera sp. G1-22]MDO6719643.1 hypothetical protein [Psychrosphaera sp. 1_MG-2023]